MPGSGAMKVGLTGAEENPPASTQAKGSGSCRVAEDGTITGAVTTERMQGTMAHSDKYKGGEIRAQLQP